MAEWKARVKLKDLLSDSDDPSEARRIAGVVAERLKAEFKARLEVESDDYDYGLDDCIFCFEDVKGADDASAVSEFNGSMDQLYDWADGARVWIE